MSDDKRCGKCKWWKEKDKEHRLGECCFKLPAWIQGCNLRYQEDTLSESCPCYEEAHHGE